MVRPQKFLLVIVLFTSSIAFAQQDSITQSDIESVKRDTTRRSVQIGDFMFNQVLFKHRLDPPIIFLNLHENEQTSIEALKKYAPDTAISYTYLEHGGERRISFTIGEDFDNFSS